MIHEPDVHHLLWTSGWDSTFRLLQLLVVRQRPVQPYYLIDPTRRSTPIEIQARRRIRESLFARVPTARSLLRATIFKDISDLPPDPVLEGQLQHLRLGGWLGEQYVWLAGFAKEAGLTGLEVCFNRQDRPRERLQHDVVGEVDGGGGFLRLVDRPSDPGLELFRPFHFPAPGFNITKPEMAGIAEAEGFGDLMELTWFCHTPWHGKPCGTCAPCRDIVTEGLGRRLPWWARVRQRIRF